VIARHGLDAKKSLGQHFLLDPAITGRIAAVAGGLAGRHVIEVGPGPGGLTRALLDSDAVSVLAIELDRRAIAALAELEAVSDGRLRVIEGDARRFDATSVPAPRQIIANLPYNVATPLLVGWLRQAGEWEQMLLMFQLEVAQRICAEVNSAAYGRLSVLAQAVCSTEIALRLPAGAFSPPPKVDSAVVRLRPLADLPPPALLARLEKVTEAAFGQRRKMLRGSLKSLGGEALLARVGIDAERRAETLTTTEFLKIADAL